MAGVEPSAVSSDDSEQSEDENPTETPEREILWASAAGEVAAVKRIIKDHREVINTTDKDLYTPLHRAAYSNHNVILKLLLHYGGDVSSRTIDGWTPLHSACRWGNIECVRPLVRAKSNINALSNSGQTPLHLAASERNTGRTLKYLLRQPDLDKSLVNSVGDTAKDIAARRGPFAHLFNTVKQKPLKDSSALTTDDTNISDDDEEDVKLQENNTVKQEPSKDLSSISDDINNCDGDDVYKHEPTSKLNVAVTTTDRTQSEIDQYDSKENIDDILKLDATLLETDTEKINRKSDVPNQKT